MLAGVEHGAPNTGLVEFFFPCCALGHKEELARDGYQWRASEWWVTACFACRTMCSRLGFSRLLQISRDQAGQEGAGCQCIWAVEQDIYQIG